MGLSGEQEKSIDLFFLATEDTSLQITDWPFIGWVLEEREREREREREKERERERERQTDRQTDRQ